MRKCPYCNVKMDNVNAVLEPENISYDYAKCPKCGEELLNMVQLKKVARAYEKMKLAKKSKFAKWGNSLAVRIPAEYIEDLNVKAGTSCTIKKEKDGLKIIPT